MNDIRLARVLANRANTIKGCTVTGGLFRDTAQGFRVETETGAIFDVMIHIYKDAIE